MDPLKFLFESSIMPVTASLIADHLRQISRLFNANAKLKYTSEALLLKDDIRFKAVRFNHLSAFTGLRRWQTYQKRTFQAVEAVMLVVELLSS